jgi:hypothetical protein
MTNIDWEKEAGNEYQVYPEGTYKVTINGYEETTASTGTKQIRWKASILEPKQYIDKPITIHTALTEKSLWRVARLVKGCGINLKTLGKMELFSNAFFKVLDSCVRRTAYWHLAVVQDNKGNDRNDVDDFRVDNDQQPIDAAPADDDAPDFLKEVKK